MTIVQIDAGTLTASANDRTVTGLLVPYGEECRSNLGRFSVDTGAFSLPDPSVVGFNVEHAREDSIGRATVLRETPQGIVATFSVAPGPEGDKALADIQAGTRKHISSEVANLVIRGGKAVAGRLFGAALVKDPAFPSATLLAAAVDTVDPAANADPASPTTTVEKTVDEYTDEQGITHTRTTTTTTVVDGDTTTITTTTEITDPAQPDPNQEAPVGAATAPNTLTASAPAKTASPSKEQMFTLLAAADRGDLPAEDVARLQRDARATTLFAALSDVKYDGVGGITTAIQQPAWIGEVWDGNDYIQKYVPLFDHGDLTSLKFLGYKWDVKPHGGDWAGNKSDVPSNAPKFKPITGDASRYAMAHDIARELQDLRVFGDVSFFDAYFNAATEDYKKWVDAKTLAGMLATAVPLVADNPAGLAVGPAMSAIVDGAAKVIANNATPTFAVVELSYWKQIAKTPSKDILGYLNAQLSLTGQEGALDQFKLIPSTDLPASSVVVGSRNAITVRELGGTPIRADALDIARGGIDHGFFGYAGVQVNKPDAIVKVTPYAA